MLGMQGDDCPALLGTGRLSIVNRGQIPDAPVTTAQLTSTCDISKIQVSHGLFIVRGAARKLGITDIDPFKLQLQGTSEHSVDGHEKPCVPFQETAVILLIVSRCCRHAGRLISKCSRLRCGACCLLLAACCCHSMRSLHGSVCWHAMADRSKRCCIDVSGSG